MGHNYGIYFTFPSLYNLWIYIPTFICGCDLILILFFTYFLSPTGPGAFGRYPRTFHAEGRPTQMEILDREEERSDDEREPDSDGDEDLEVEEEGEPRLKRVLQLIRPVPKRWNSTYYLVKRALALKEALVQFAACHPPRPGEHPAMIPIDDNVEVFVRSCSWTTTLCPSSLSSKVVSLQVVTNYHVFTTNIGGATNIWNNAWSRLSN